MGPTTLPHALAGPLLVLAACLGACGDAPTTLETGSAPARPNVLVYLVDTTRADHLSAYGYERATTPHLAALASEAVVFERAFSPSSWTRASTASLLTGVDPVHHGARSRNQRVSDEVPLLAERLTAAGYACAAIVTNPHVVETWGFSRGCEVFEDLGSLAPTWQDANAALVLEHARAQLDRLAGDPRPFFLYLHTIDPHGPNIPPEGYSHLFLDDPQPAMQPGELTPETPREVVENMRGLYDAEIRYSDDVFGELVEDLRRRGLFEDTLLVFTSDHGEEHLEHGRGGHGQQLFQELVHVPLLVKFPHGRFAGTRVAARASLLDVVPTVLGELGVEGSEALDGHDLRPLAQAAAPWDPTSEWEERPFFLDLDLVRHDGVLHRAAGVVRGRWKFVEEEEPLARRFLFDLVEDPAEQTNLLDREPALATELGGLVRAYQGTRDAGLHLRVAGERDDDAPVYVHVRVTAATGVLRSARGVGLEPEDQWTIDPERGFEATLCVRAVPGQGKRGRLQADVDEVIVRADPPDAELHLEVFDAEADLPLFLGAARASDPAWPIAVSARTAWACEVPADEGKRVTPGRYVWVQSVPDGVTLLPPELVDRLRGLGYAGDEDE